jgi:hypothetical protein
MLEERATMKSPLHIIPFSIQIEAEILSDLRERIRNTRWPDQAPGSAWKQGPILITLDSCLGIGPTISIGSHKSAS